MVRRSFSQGMLYGDSRRSLRSDKTACDSNNQMTTGTNNWKSLPSSKRTSLPPVSNGHHLRSKSVENSPKLSEEYNTIEAQCNGITSSHHSYGTRYGAKLTEHSNLKLTPSRKCSNWDECFDGRFSNNRISSSPVVNSSESSQLTSASDLGHALRSRHVWFSNNIASETNELEYENEQINAKSNNHRSLDKDYQDCKADCVASDVTVPKVTNKEQKGYRNPESKHFNNQTMKRKRLTAEEKLIEDNKAYYKLEVKNSKLRSSGYYLSQTDPSVCVAEESVLNVDFTTETTVNCNGEQSELLKFKEAINEKAEPVAEVKRNKIRLSELSLLNNEAENFMFGEPSRSYDSEDDSSNGSQNFKIDGCNLNSSHDDVTIMYKDCGKEPNISIKDKKLNGDALNDSHNSDFKCDVSYKLSCDYNHSEIYSNGVNGSQKRHRRKAHNDALLNDSRDFIKCEEVVSKISTQSNAYSNTSLNMPNKLESEPAWSESQEWTRNDSDSTAVKYESSINVNTSSSECDSREQKNIAISKAAGNLEKKAPNMTLSDVKAGALTVLHFSFEAIPESEPWYQTYQRQDEGEEYYLSGVNDCMYWKSFLLPYEMPHDHFTSAVSSNSAPKCTNTGPIKRRKRKGNSNLLDKKPRKSPRCHASTLAILSSLMHHRKRKESDKVKEELFKSSYCGNEATDVPLPEKQNGTDLGKDVRDVTLNIDQLFGTCTDVGLQSDNQPNDDKCVKCVKSKSLKCKRTHKSLNSSNSKKYEIDNLCAKDCEGIDIDPAAFEELVGRGENPLSCIDDLTLRNRGGPSMDVISLLNGYASCCCVDELRNKDMPRCDSGFQSSSFKESYNSSECASSTCETVQYSDLTDNVRVRGKKRKRKKNLTGWPVEKQKLKRRLMLKLARPEVHSSGIERNSKIKEGHDEVSEDNIACEINKEKCVEVEGCSSGLVTNSETSDSLNARHGSISSEVCVENLCGETHPEVCDVEGREIFIDKISTVDHVNSCAAVASVSTTEKLCSSRTASIDSNSQHCDFQPRVRVKKMNNVSTLNFVIKTPASVSSVNNSRRLRSTSYLPSGTLRKKQFFGCGDKMEIVRRASARMKKSCSRWDSWSTRRRR